MAQFGEDDILGTPLGGGRVAQAVEKFGIDSKTVSLLAKVVEIIVLLIIDAIIIFAIILIFNTILLIIEVLTDPIQTIGQIIKPYMSTDQTL